jgi:type I restriction enzyme R subunit
MKNNEQQTCRQRIEPALKRVAWEWDSQVRIGRGRINLSGEQMYDESQEIIADYVLRFRGVPLAVLEAKAETEDASEGVQQGERYAKRLGLRFSIATNGAVWILSDLGDGSFETLDQVPSPDQLLEKMGASVDWSRWEASFRAGYHLDQLIQKRVRPYQDMAIFKTLWHFASGHSRALLLMATGTGKTFTVFQLIWKMMNGNALKQERVLFLTDRNSLKDQAYRAFSAFPSAERVTVDKPSVAEGTHRVGKIFFANYQNLDEELDGKKLYEHYEPDFFDLVVIDECHRSGFGDWFGVLRHFESAFQLGLTATPRELEEIRRPLSEEEMRRDTVNYFGDEIYRYSLKQAIEDGYLVPYLLEERTTNLDAEGYKAGDGHHFQTQHFEREIRLPDRTRAIAEDLWTKLNTYGLEQEKTIVFCVDDTHAAFMAAELRRLSGDSEYAARITRSERNSHQLERNFGIVGPGKPRVAVTVDLLSTGFDAPDVRNIVFVRPLRSAILYKQMKGRGTRTCEDIDKRYFTIFDYSGASQLEDSEFDGHPANQQKPARKTKPKKKEGEPEPKPVEEGVDVYISGSDRFVCLADGRRIPFDEYMEQTRELVRSIAPKAPDELLHLWVHKDSRQEVREALRDQDIYPAAFRHYLDLPDTDDVDILAKVGFTLPRVPTRPQRVDRFWDQESGWLQNALGIFVPTSKPDLIHFPKPEDGRIAAASTDAPVYGNPVRLRFWQTALDHYALYGIDDLERGKTYGAPQFAEQFGSFSRLTRDYGGADRLRRDLESVKEHLYVAMSA